VNAQADRHKRAARYLQRMDSRIKAQLVAKLEELARDPNIASGVKPMAGEWAGFFRLRHGDLRVICMHDRAGDSIIIAHIGPRGDVYK
jgi:mRNA interferase RelE/StbE